MAFQIIQYHVMVIAGFEIIKYLRNYALFLDEKTNAMNAIVFLAHKFFRSPNAECVGNRMIFIA